MYKVDLGSTYFLKNAYSFLPINIPFIAAWQSANKNLPVPDSVSFLGDGRNSIDALCSSTLPILLHMIYHIPARL